MLFSLVSERLILKRLKPNYGLVHFATGHGPYKEKLCELRIIENSDYDCAERATRATFYFIAFWIMIWTKLDQGCGDAP